MVYIYIYIQGKEGKKDGKTNCIFRGRERGIRCEIYLVIVVLLLLDILRQIICPSGEEEDEDDEDLLFCRGGGITRVEKLFLCLMFSFFIMRQTEERVGKNKKSPMLSPHD